MKNVEKYVAQQVRSQGKKGSRTITGIKKTPSSSLKKTFVRRET